MKFDDTNVWLHRIKFHLRCAWLSNLSKPSSKEWFAFRFSSNIQASVTKFETTTQKAKREDEKNKNAIATNVLPEDKFPYTMVTLTDKYAVRWSSFEITI